MEPLKKNTKLKLMDDKGTFIVSELLGEGGQGQVYRGTVNGKEYALKYYTSHQSSEFCENLLHNIRTGSPDKHFLWPLAMVDGSIHQCGYLMELRPKGYQEFSQFLLARVRFSSWSAIVNAALSVTLAFRSLSRAGLSYQDLNDGNFFFHPDTGDVLICDNDNVTPPDTNLGILGKCRYMAPEVVKGICKPNNLSDYYSLSVILFMILFANHPLEGKRSCELPCFNDAVEHELYGRSPLFIYDPNDQSNTPVPGVHSNVIRRWPLYPLFIREAFIRAFSQEILNDPNRRITCNEWLQILSQLRALVVPCGCGNEFFFDLRSVSSNCFNCGHVMAKPLMLSCQHGETPLALGKRLFISDVNGADFLSPLGQVVANTKNPSIWGLRNETTSAWEAVYPNQTKTIESGQALLLMRGITVTIDNQVVSIK